MHSNFVVGSAQTFSYVRTCIVLLIYLYYHHNLIHYLFMKASTCLINKVTCFMYTCSLYTRAHMCSGC